MVLPVILAPGRGKVRGIRSLGISATSQAASTSGPQRSLYQTNSTGSSAGVPTLSAVPRQVVGHVGMLGMSF